MLRYRTTSPGETFEFGRAIGSCLSGGQTIYLSGDLGAGKSVLARGVASGLGVEGPMPSPSYTLLNSYVGRLPLHHFDLYRLGGEDEFYEAGLDEVIGEGVCVVEWPERADPRADSRMEITICPVSDDMREIEIGYFGMDNSAQIERSIEGWRVQA